MKTQMHSLATIMGLFLLLASTRPGCAFYDPAAQRWINRDPIGERDTLNLFTFTKNAPTIRLDGNGHAILPWIIKRCAKPAVCTIASKQAFGPCAFLGEAEIVGADPSASRLCLWVCCGVHHTDETGVRIWIQMVGPPVGPCAPPTCPDLPPTQVVPNLSRLPCKFPDFSGFE